jgi:nucleoside-diphosphate-sugar epimerase
MKVLVTGGSGFIGGYVVENLRERGIEVTVFDHRSHGYALAGENIFLGDTRDFTAVNEAVAVHDGVIHLAGVLGTQETINEPRPAVETNIFGGLNVFQACRNYGVRCVYIAVGNHWMNNSYSISKTTAERFAHMFNKEHGTRIAVVRALNAYGPRQKSEPVRKIMPNIVLPLLRGESVQIYGDGEQIMDMIYVEDVAEYLVRALLNDLKPECFEEYVFEAGSGLPTTVNNVVDMVHRVAQLPGNWRDWVDYLPMRPGEPEKSVVLGRPSTLDPLGPLVQVPLEVGVKKTWEYYRSITP